MDAPLRGVPGGGAGGGREGGLSGETAPAAGGAGAVASDRPVTGLERLGRRLLVPVGLALLALIGLVLVADARELAGQLSGFPLRLLPPVLALSLVNYLLRFLRWETYLARLGVALPRARSLGVFLVGFLLSVTPGKAGELGKAWLVRELGGGRALRVVPAVVAERVTDLLGVLVLLALGALALPGGRLLAAAGLAAVVLAVSLLAWRGAARWVFGLLARLPLVGRRTPVLAELYETLLELTTPGLLAAALALSIVAWGAEGVGFFLVVREYAPEAGLLPAVFNYTVSTCLGSLSMLPGGLVAAEGSLTALLDAQGLSTAAAASATLIIRAATLWFAVVLGLLALPFVARRLRPPSSDARFPSFSREGGGLPHGRRNAGSREDRALDPPAPR